MIRVTCLLEGASLLFRVSVAVGTYLWTQGPRRLASFSDSVSLVAAVDSVYVAHLECPKKVGNQSIVEFSIAGFDFEPILSGALALW